MSLPKALTGFSINGVAGTFNGNSIQVLLKWTGLTNLVAEFSTNGASVQINGTTQVSGYRVRCIADLF